MDSERKIGGCVTSDKLSQIVNKDTSTNNSDGVSTFTSICTENFTVKIIF